MDKTVEKKEFNGENILEVKNLKKYFVIKKSLFGKPEAYLKAVDNVSFSVKTGFSLNLTMINILYFPVFAMCTFIFANRVFLIKKRWKAAALPPQTGDLRRFAPCRT